MILLETNNNVMFTAKNSGTMQHVNIKIVSTKIYVEDQHMDFGLIKISVKLVTQMISKIIWLHIPENWGDENQIIENFIKIFYWGRFPICSWIKTSKEVTLLRAWSRFLWVVVQLFAHVKITLSFLVIVFSNLVFSSPAIWSWRCNSCT